MCDEISVSGRVLVIALDYVDLLMDYLCAVAGRLIPSDGNGEFEVIISVNLHNNVLISV